VTVDLNEGRLKQGETSTTAAAGGASTPSAAGRKPMTKPEPAPPPLTRNLDSGPSLPIPVGGSREKAGARLRLWAALALGLAAAIVFLFWLVI
jgi:hypothetical protein